MSLPDRGREAARPREGMYLFMGLLVGVSLLNTVLIFVLWGRVDEFAGEQATPDAHAGDVGTTPAGGGPPPSPESVDPQSAAPDPASGAPTGGPGSPVSGGDEGESVVAEPGATERAVTAAQPPATAAEGAGEGVRPGVEPTPPPPPPPPEEWALELDRPATFDPSLLPLLLDEVAPRSLDRTVLLLGAARWGEDLAPRARALLDQEATLLAAAWPDAFPDPDRLVISFSFDPRSPADRALRGELAALAQVWEKRWATLVERARDDPRVSWGRAVRAARTDGAVDLVLLVDLSESMSSEVATARGAFRAMVPAFLAAHPGLRVGWVGYRDEVVERESLSSDAAVLLDSFDRWACQAGGDVPEALDEALFEAFRVGGFAWRPDAEHRFLVLGDAPPPYERIEGMLELARAAHESPERFTIDTLGVLREPEYPDVPAFRDLAESTGGQVRFVPAGGVTPQLIWELLIGAPEPAWEDAPPRRS